MAPFDYTSYYNAIKSGDATRKNKNPLEIYEKQVLDTSAGERPLRTSNIPGPSSRKQP